MNELYVIVTKKNGIMVGRLAFRTRAEAEAYLGRHGATRRDYGRGYTIERYVPAPLEVVR